MFNFFRIPGLLSGLLARPRREHRDDLGANHEPECIRSTRDGQPASADHRDRDVDHHPAADPYRHSQSADRHSGDQ